MSIATLTPSSTDRPAYDRGTWRPSAAWWGQSERRAQLALATCAPQLTKPLNELRVLDLGSGYGGMTLKLAEHCQSVVGLEPCAQRVAAAEELQRELGRKNVEFRTQGVELLDDVAAYDLIVLDNVLEHLANQRDALRRMTRALAPGGVLFILVPNRLWPIEVHYHLPLLSYLPLRWANVYLRLSGHGRDYTDASYAPTYWSLNRFLRQEPELSWEYVLPANLSLARRGHSWLYQLGAAAIRRAPRLWAISKSLLVVAVKRAPLEVRS
jgi:SAM-dependent methyltransferase